MRKVIFTLLLCSLFLINKSTGQLYLGNFLGSDSETINGLGSYEIPLGFPIPIKKFDDKHKIIFGPSYTWAQTYFNDKWVVSTDGNTTTLALDDDPSHEYKKSIFSHQSKIRTWAWEAWLGFESSFGKVTVDFFYAPTYIQVGSFRRKFVENNEVVKIVDRFKDKADFYNINRLQHRLKGSLTVSGIGVGGFLNLTPFFNSNSDIDLQKFGLTIMVRDSFFDQLLNLGDDDDNENKSPKNPDVKEMMF